MKLILVAVIASVVVAAALPPSCERPVYCDSKLLHHVQMARIYNDSKTFVDFQMKTDEQTILAEFDKLLAETSDSPTKEQLQEFVNKYFDNTSELEKWTPPDFNQNPPYLRSIRDKKLRQFASDINQIWPVLGRKVKDIVHEKPELFSFIPVHNGFIIPGGRFTELYYWDTYWIIEGLLISGMKETVKGIIGNLIELQRKFGHIPNGARWYYQERSQPPLLSGMVSQYMRATNDLKFLRENIDALESEMEYWLDTQSVTFDVCGKQYTLLRYFAPSEGPRPESYYEDYTNAQTFPTEELRKEFYVSIKSGAESGWDFSTRWFVDQNGGNRGNLSTIHTFEIVPVDLNSIFANAMQNLASFYSKIGQPRKGVSWDWLAEQWRNDIQDVLWNKEDGIWYDWDLEHGQHRKYFYPSNVAPLWMRAVDKVFIKEKGPVILKYLKNSHGLDYPGGVPTSLIRSGEQWDFPNAWPPLVSIMINGLEALKIEEASKLAFTLAQRWVRANYKGFNETKAMFEKYDVELPGKVGGGGEYQVQLGFGWTNGVVLEMLSKYGKYMTAEENPQVKTVPSYVAGGQIV
ncbi:trehalase-like [Aricia agestis]|uniref:trehalase-like n=1 Tax=Aricia agestis TaxID=91739 RepID=UPI001C207978|nr:trehalase-like [Aricia agestis]XP_041977938.1 trehalase-like [Aricia agestis]XP_041977939.1 trehalase-like [Aricia agestis]XP_041977940.1 trehalase-like [Aricia agestis]